MQILSVSPLISWIRRFKTLNMALIRCPLSFFEEIIAAFSNEKNLKLTPKITKITKFSSFQSFDAFFVKFLTLFVDGSVL